MHGRKIHAEAPAPGLEKRTGMRYLIPIEHPLDWARVFPSFSEVRLSDVLDVVIVATLIWVSIAWLQNTRARLSLLGIAILGAFYFLAQQFEFQLTTWLLQGFFAVVVLILVIVFQDDLRRLFERIAIWGLRRQAPKLAPDLLDTLVSASARLAQQRTGALIVLPGREPLDRHLEGGTYLRGRVSEPLLMSLFDSNSPGHDGAVILHGQLVSRFGTHLPLSRDWDRLGRGGTRHAAALGLAERTDSLCIAVSEERGVISVAEGGELVALPNVEALAHRLRHFMETVQPNPSTPVGSSAVRLARRWGEALLALVLASFLWFVAIPGATVTTATREVPVLIENLPEGYELVDIDPPRVEVVLEGRRRDLYLAGSEDLQAVVDALLVQLGRRTFQVGPDLIAHPAGLRVTEVRPHQVKLSVERGGGS